MKDIAVPIRCYAHKGGGHWLWINRILEVLPDDLAAAFARDRHLRLPAAIGMSGYGYFDTLHVKLRRAASPFQMPHASIQWLAATNLHLVRPNKTASGRIYLPKRLRSSALSEVILSAHNTTATLSQIRKTKSYLLTVPLDVTGGGHAGG